MEASKAMRKKYTVVFSACSRELGCTLLRALMHYHIQPVFFALKYNPSNGSMDTQELFTFDKGRIAKNVSLAT